jgi:hypothetical protein
MPFFHIPVVEIMRLLMKIRKNRPFMRMSRIFMLSLIALSAISYSVDWAKAFDPASAPCVLGKWECYQGTPLDFSQFIFQLDIPERLFLLPLIDFLAALLFYSKYAEPISYCHY